MKKRFSFFIVCLIVLLFAICDNAFSKQRVYPGYVVKFSNDTTKSKNTKSLFTFYNYKINKSYKNYSLIMPGSASKLNFKRQEILEYNENDDTCLKLKELGAIECSPNFEFKISTIVPNDTYYQSQWGLGQSGINAVNAWDKTKGSKRVVVAVVDTGIDYTHQDLIDNIWVNPNEIPNNGIDDDDNGIIDDIHGANFIVDTGDPMDDNGHGTHVAGIIGAKGNNSKGVSGVNWTTSIIALKFLNDRGSGSLYNAIRAYEYLLDLKKRGINIKVANNSWGGAYYTEALYTAMKNLANSGVVLTAAAGNESEDNDSVGAYPANFDIDNLISVAAVTEDGSIADFSNVGLNSVDIAAPGSRILSTHLNNAYASMSGTSMATPFVSGAAALLFGYDSSLSAKNVVERIYNTGREEYNLIGAIRTERMLDVSRLVNNESTPLPQAPNCTYEMSKISFDSTNLAEAQPILLQADENTFYNLALPFNFPYYGKEYSSMYISPNGVVYLGYQPVTYDYTNKQTPSPNSIAALHTDLIAKNDPYGVRVYKDYSKVVIYWRAKHYSMQYADNKGDVYVKLVLKSDGVIEDYISFYDTDTLDVVSNKTTIGIAGRGTLPLVYTYNNAPNVLTNNLALRYKPICEEATTFTVDNINVYRFNKSKRILKNLKRNKNYQILVDGAGTGTVQARLGFEFGYCQDLLNIKVKDGKAILNGSLKLPINYAKKLKVEIPKYNLKNSRNIAIENNALKRYSAKKSKRQLKSRCKKLLANIK